MAKARCEKAKVVGQQSCGPDAFILELEFDQEVGPIDAGQFVMLSPADGSGPVLPRPFSFYGQTSAHRLTFLVQVIGKGTQALADVELGGLVQVTLPLGTGFSLPEANRPAVMLAGGVGSAPFLLLAEKRVAEKGTGGTEFIFGARNEDRLYDRATFEKLQIQTRFATDDGSFGFHGNVLQCLESGLKAGEISADAKFFACGPEPLLKAFAAFAKQHDLEGQVSLETYMGCGYGACNACPTATNPEGPLGDWPWAKTCQEGPAFDLNAVIL